MSTSVTPFGSVNQFDSVSCEARLRDIALFAIGSKEVDAAKSTEIKGGRGRIGILDGRVVKFNTHTLERSGGPKADKAMYDSCNALRRTLVDIARGLGVSENDATMRKIRDLLQLGEDGAVPPKKLLDRSTVAKVVNLLGSAKNKDYWEDLTIRQVKRVASTDRDMHFGTVGADMRRQAFKELIESGASDGPGQEVVDNIIRGKFDEALAGFDPKKINADNSWRGNLWGFVNGTRSAESLSDGMKAKRWQMATGLMREFAKAEVREQIVRLVGDRTCKDAAEAWESIVRDERADRRGSAFAEIMERSAFRVRMLLDGFNRLWGDGSANGVALARKIRNGLGMQLMPLLMGSMFDDKVRPKTNIRAQAIVEALLGRVRSFVQSQKDVISLESLSLPDLYKRVCKWDGANPVSADELGQMDASAIRDEIRRVFYSRLPKNPPVIDVKGPIDDVSAKYLTDGLLGKVSIACANQGDYMLYDPFARDVVRGNSVHFDTDVTIETNATQYNPAATGAKATRKEYAEMFKAYFKDEALAGLAAVLCNQILSNELLMVFQTGMLRERMMVSYDDGRIGKWAPFEVKRREDGDYEISYKEERPVFVTSSWQDEGGVSPMLRASQQLAESHFKGNITLRIGKIDAEHPLPAGAAPVRIGNEDLYILADRSQCTYDVNVVAKPENA